MATVETQIEEQPTEPTGASGDEIKLTSAQLKERLDRAQRSAVSQALEGLGVKSQAELKRMMDDYRKAQEEKLSEVDRLKQRLSEAETEREQARALARTTAVRAAFQTQAAMLGATYPEDALALAGDTGRYFDEAGQIVGVQEAVQALIDTGRLPVKAQKPQAPTLNAGAGGGQRATEAKATALSSEELEIARKLNIAPEAYLARKKDRKE